MSFSARTNTSQWTAFVLVLQFPDFLRQPNYYVRTSKIRSLAKAVYCGQYHFVATEQRASWEEYSFQHDGWVMESIKIQERDDSFGGTIIKEYETSPMYTYGIMDGPMSPDGYLPNWQTGPVVPTVPPYNWDGYVYTSMTNALPTLFNLEVVISAVANPVPDENDVDAVQLYASNIAWIKDFLGDDEDPKEPYSDILYPIVDQAKDNVNILAEKTIDQKYKVVAIFIVTFFWRHLLTEILSESSQGKVFIKALNRGRAEHESYVTVSKNTKQAFSVLLEMIAVRCLRMKLMGHVLYSVASVIFMIPTMNIWVD